MRIWIDIGNSPHVNFFAPLIEELKDEHEIVITTRPFANNLALLRQKRCVYTVVGKHYGANKVKKVLGFGIRALQLYLFLRKKAIDVAISHSCFGSPIVSRVLGVKSIYLNDNEHAAGNTISFLFADRIMVPEFLDIKKVKRQWAAERKIIQYPGVKEGVYLWTYIDKPQHRLPMKIYIRPEPWMAQYYKGKKFFMDDLIIEMKKHYPIVLLPRGEEQALYYRKEKFNGIEIPEESLSLQYITETCLLFIGAGGTMTREAAVLGIPTISIYQDELLDVDKYLIQNNRMTHKVDINADFVEEFIRTINRKEASLDLLKKGKLAYDLIKRTLFDIGKRRKSCYEEQ